MTSFNRIYRSFLSKIEDTDLIKFEEYEQEEILRGYLEEALTILEMKNFKIDSDYSLIDEKNKCFVKDFSRREIEVVAMLMVAAWYSPKINSLETTLLFTGSSSDKWSSQKEHLNSMISARDYWITNARKMCRDKSTNKNSYLGG